MCHVLYTLVSLLVLVCIQTARQQLVTAKRCEVLVMLEFALWIYA
jgi:hypothetical protein